MTIKIHHKLKPFSHQKGAKFLIPGSTTQFTVFPTRIIFEDVLNRTYCHTLDLKLKNFYKDFTVEADFEKNTLRIFGCAESSFIELEIYKQNQELYLVLKRFKENKLETCLDNIPLILEIKKPVLILKESKTYKVNHQRLDFGISKKQDLTRINQDKNLKEYLPYLFALGASLKLPESFLDEEVFKLISDLETNDQNVKKHGLDELVCGYYHDLVPILNDDLHQGLLKQKSAVSCLYLNQKMYEYILSFLAKISERRLNTLKGLPHQLVAGKATGLEFDFGTLSLEWTKGFIRQMTLEISHKVSFDLVFPKEVKAFRVRKDKKVVTLSENFEPGIYHFDNFQA